MRERLIMREQRLTATIQERAEAQSAVQDLTEQMTALRKKVDRQRKEAKANEESLRMTRGELERAWGGRGARAGRGAHAARARRGAAPIPTHSAPPA